MTGRVPDEILQLIRARVSIAEVVSGYVTLKRVGRNYSGLCPFHDEKTPSFTVNEERGLFHCFGCGAGGTIFNFVMRADHIGFREAVEALAQRAGVEIPRRPEEVAAERQRSGLVEVNAQAERYFCAALLAQHGRVGREYLRGRGLSQATIERYGIGYCPPGGGLARALTGGQDSIGRAVEVGLLARRSDGSIYERFRGRVMFPIRDSAGRVVGFGGRSLGDDPPKYLNSPESTLFHKGSVLYGLFEAREAIRGAGRMVLVEGYVDALALVQNGIGYAVATLGTALGVSQLRLARRFAPEVVAFFDGDRAGRDAAAKAFVVCLQAEIWGLGAFLPDGFDPDTFVQKKGRDATIALLGGAQPLAEFFLERNAPARSATVPERARAARSVGQVLALLKDPVQFDLLARLAAQRLGIDESFFRELRQEQERGSGRNPGGPVPADRGIVGYTEGMRPEEAALVEAAIVDQRVASLVRESGAAALFDDRSLATALEEVVRQWEQGGDATSILSSLPPGLCARVSADLVGLEAGMAAERLTLANDCITRIRERNLRMRVNGLRADLHRAEASGDHESYLTELRRMDDALRRRVVPSG